ncbi:DUF397 domain-containing protein [Lentzea sp. NPDC051213]|uniref:DUF397 domain-containing protein n=1 Tax=Lentzea sp. NPDC051213 TaxID=3364126 RepID=UPI00378A50BC
MSTLWRKSSRSGGGGSGNCVEIALNGSMARVRDSKNRAGSVIGVPEWAAFIGAVKRGEFEKA